MHYPLNKNNARLRKKYSDCDYVIVNGSTVRQLTAEELAEFRERIERIMYPTPRTRPAVRRSVV